MIRLLATAAAVAVLSAPAPAGAAECKGPFPFSRHDRVMERNLVKKLKAAGYNRLLEKEALAVALVDLTRPGKIYYAGLNDNEMLYAASLPKIAILLAVVQAANDGRIEWTHTHDRRLMDMIVASDNADASWGTDLVGLLAIEDVMRDPRYCLYDDVNGGLWVGRAYRSGGATNRDPNFGISHGSTARQAARFYMMLEAGKLVTPHWSFRMMNLMAPPKHHHKFVAGLRERTGVVFMARKSGSWRNFHSDSAIIQHDHMRYIAVVISESKQGEKLVQHVIRLMDDVIAEGTHRKRGRHRSAKR